MKINLVRLFAGIILTTATIFPTLAKSTLRHFEKMPADDYVVQTYLPFWNDGYHPDAKVLSRFTSVVVAFAVPQKNGAVTYDRSLQENLNVTLKAIQDAKKLNPNLKYLWAIGGWGNSDNFASAVSPANRPRFIESLLGFIKQFKADGIDIDWEFPRVADRANLTAFVRDLNAAVNKRGLNYQITMAVNGAEGANTAGINIQGVAPFLDHFNVMTYDFYGNWSPMAGLHSAVFKSSRLAENLNAEASIEYYLKIGVPARKIVIGATAYGKIQGAGAGVLCDGLGEKSLKTGGFTFQGKRYAEEISYSQLKKLPGAWKSFFDGEANSPYLYNQQNKIFISYDDPRSVNAKIDLIKKKDLGGLMIWDFPGDADGELINAMLGGFGR